MAPEKKETIREMDRVLTVHGFKRRSSTWYLTGTETLRVINLDWLGFAGNWYGVVLAVRVNMPNQQPYPKYYECHWSGSLMHSCEDGESRRVVMEFDTDPTTARRTKDGIRFGTSRPGARKLPSYYARSIKELCFIIEDEGLPFLEEMGTIDGLRKLVEDRLIWPVPATLRDVLR